ncbi:MAG: Gfo/Idh/MocA family oxidoreductase [Bryobacteraceae bacterium]
MPAAILLAAVASLNGADLRLGIVGTDTSHAAAFTAILNDTSRPDHLAGARVVAAYKGGSPDLPDSANRVDKFAEEMKSKYGVEIVPDIATLLDKVDAVLLESVDGRTHLAQFREIVKGHKPVFIDKPLASTLSDAREIARVAREAGVPWFSSSSLRFSDGLAALKLDGLNGVFVWAPGPMEPHHELDLSWYGIHGVEMLYTLMGTGCEQVSRISTPDADIVTGRWKDGRLGALRLMRPYSGYGATAFSPKLIRTSDKDLYTGYRDLVAEIIKFFQTGKPPVDERETMEMFEFMDAAQRSLKAGSAPVPIR